MEKKVIRFLPAVLAILVSLGFVLWRLADKDWNPAALAEPGTQYSQGDVNGSEGYDGQFSYYIALDPNPDRIKPFLDNPPYRYQRIAYPLAARLLSFASPTLIPWMLLAVNVVSHGLGTYAVTQLLVRYQQPTRYALIYGLWVGLVGPVGLDMPEPMAYMLAVWALICFLDDRVILSAALMTAAVFTREALLPFMVAMAAVSIFRHNRKSLCWIISGLVVYGIWQGWLFLTFGQFGLGTGGAGDSGFEWIPLMGLFKVAQESVKVFALYLLIFGPSIIIPAIWGLTASIRALKSRLGSLEAWLLLVNAIVILFLPFSTFREPLAVVRLATGLVLSVILFSAENKLSRPLNFGMFWIAFLILVFQSTS